MKSKKQGGPLLSIGMIVKNEGKKLRRCLESLVPLMNEVSCELIIADTGSTDETVGIAQEFTDQVFSYEWNDDFSAARNSTLDRSSGKWYMYIDADEWMLDWKPLKEFLISKRADKYNTATFQLENYTSANFETYSLSEGVRMVRRATGVRFSSEIHECLPVLAPLFTSAARLGHDGYVYETEQQRKDKFDRNKRLLLKELEGNPSDPRVYAHLMDASYPAEGLSFVEKGLSLVRKNVNHGYYGTIFRRAGAIYQSLGLSDPLGQLCEEYFQEGNPPRQTDMDMHILYADVLLEREDFEGVLQHYETYFKLYDRFQKDGNTYTDAPYGTIASISPFVYNGAVMGAVKVYCKLKRYEDAYNCMMRPYAKHISQEQLIELTVLLGQVAVEAEHGEWMAAYFEKAFMQCREMIQNAVIGTGKEEDVEQAEKAALEKLTDTFSRYYFYNPSIRHAFTQAISLLEIDTPFVRTMKAIASAGDEDFEERLDSALQNYDSSCLIHTEYLYLAISSKKNFVSLLDRLTLEEMGERLVICAMFHDDYAARVHEYPADRLLDTTKGLCLLQIMLEKAVVVCDTTSWQWDFNKNGSGLGGLSQQPNLPDDQRMELIAKYMEIGNEWMERLYSPDSLLAENETLLPVGHRSLRRLWRAGHLLENGDELEYVRTLKRLLAEYPPLKAAVEFLLQRYQEKQKAGNAIKTEEDNLMFRFKKQVRELVYQGRRNEARQALASYQMIHPEDSEIPELLAFCDGTAFYEN